MAQRAYWQVAMGAACLAAGGATAAPQRSPDCRAIADAMARLACYDNQNGAPAPAPAPPPITRPGTPLAMQPAAPLPIPVPPPAPPPATAALAQAPGRDTFDSHVAKVVAIRHGLHRIDLEDGSAWNMSVAEQPPTVGDAVHVRRTPLGTRFFDIVGRRPISVRPGK